MNRASTLVLAGLAPSTAFVVAGGGSGYAVMLATGDVQFAASLGVVGGWLAFLSTGLLLGEMARWLGSGNSDTTPMAEPETPAPRWTGENVFAQTSPGFAEVNPPLPEYFNWRVARRVAWAVNRRGEPMTQKRLTQGGVSKGNAALLMKWLLDQRLTKWKGRDPRTGVELTGAGKDWMENIIAAWGPPPTRING